MTDEQTERGIARFNEYLAEVRRIEVEYAANMAPLLDEAYSKGRSFAERAQAARDEAFVDYVNDMAAIGVPEFVERAAAGVA